MKRTLGTCYYPEHWPEEIWEADARRMAQAGLTWVRIGEFAWSRIEPEPGNLNWDWIDRAIEVLAAAGLKIVLGTPTATPPRWMLHRHPDMLAVDAHGNPRKFGSRRHYCFSHEGYAQECDRIVRLMAERYSKSLHIGAWQTDNEYSCHDTTLSFSEAASEAFRTWLKERYGSIDALNRAWGNVFWSMDYDSFEDIDLPNLTVTEPNPAHVLAFRRFSSDQVVRFNRRQAEILRAHSDAPISHNFMGRTTDFDHFKVGDDLEIATWDSYPMGFLEDRVEAAADHKRAYARQGDPDFQAFHHDLYRAVGKGRWWVMEQQPGPVNWAPYNPAPLPGMVRLWTWEAFAHGAEAVCYFRWRQAPFAQEQMHAGLLRPDSAAAPGLDEAMQVAREIADAPDASTASAQVGLVFDYDADFAWTTQPHGEGSSYFQLVFDTYRALRKLGLSIDILPPTARDFSGYKLIAAPGLMHIPEALKRAFCETDATVVLGPRAGARGPEMEIPVPLPPDLPGLDVTVSRVESIRPDMPMALSGEGNVIGYREELETSADAMFQLKDGSPVAVANGNLVYMAGWGDQTALNRLFSSLCNTLEIKTMLLPEGVRVRDTATERFWFNYRAEPVETPVGVIPAADLVRQAL
ncbi:beta-galactosidase [Roseibium polysiphoniae]|uniref:Beta-galactosidase n=1 Tax=Roseibium polysiphoniae TaxID=2571221 RepID=A0ABR9CAZ9_9HYPH|nr:beta-galactosidase [Roseibium polysiphoniae]MBD8877060.1 beta-galactosidase [Roseibium polysiphoniae]